MIPRGRRPIRAPKAGSLTPNPASTSQTKAKLTRLPRLRRPDPRDVPTPPRPCVLSLASDPPWSSSDPRPKGRFADSPPRFDLSPRRRSPPPVSRAFAGRTHEACTPTPIVTRFSLTPRPAWTISPRRYHLTAPRRSIDRRPVNRVRRTPFPPRIRNPTHPSYSTIPPLFRRPIIERPKRGFPTVTAFGDTGTAAAASRAVAAASAIAIAPSPVALPAPLPSPTPPHYSSPLRLLRRVTRKLFERR